MLRNGDHAILRHFLSRRLGRKAQVGLDHILQLVGWLFHSLVDDDPVHGATIVKVDLRQDTGGIDSAVFVIFAALHFFFQKAGRECHSDNAVLLL